MSDSTNDAVLEALRASSMLATVNIGVWSGERTDAAALRKLADDAGAKGRVGRVVKYLMSGADVRLRAAKGAFHAITALHRTETLPWTTDNDRKRGPRLLSTMQAMDYMNKMGRAKLAADTALDEMLMHYDSDVQTARGNLATLADVVYPTVEEVRSQFYVRIALEPLPASTTFKNVPPEFSARLADRLKDRQAKMLGAAQDSMWSQLRAMVEEWRDRFADPTAVFRTALVSNGQELVLRLPAWNLIGDPRVDRFMEMWGASGADVITPEVLRTKADVRAALATDLSRMVFQLDSWGVGDTPLEQEDTP